MDRFPNIHVELGARIGELGRQPRMAREFFEKYQDRILFGTDAVPNGTDTTQQIFIDELYHRITLNRAEESNVRTNHSKRSASAPGCRCRSEMRGVSWRAIGYIKPKDMLAGHQQGIQLRRMGMVELQ
jgi:Amidohydrolase